jgi:hypothetical protein
MSGLTWRKFRRADLGQDRAMTQSSHFQQLLDAAAAQPDPQRLLFVFAAAELPDGATPAQRERFLAGEGGALAPLMCVDKAPGDLADFGALLAESRRAGPPWQVAFAARHPGRPAGETRDPGGLIAAPGSRLSASLRPG